MYATVVTLPWCDLQFRSSFFRSYEEAVAHMEANAGVEKIEEIGVGICLTREELNNDQ